MKRWTPWLVCAALIVCAGSAFAAAAVVGAVRQLPGKAGCISSSSRDTGCTGAVFMASARTILVSPDGRTVYAAGGVGGLTSLATFTRNPTAGTLKQLRAKAGCIAMSSRARNCVTAVAMETPNALALSSDGRSLYVAATNSGAIAVFRRNAVSGALSQLAGPSGCIASLNASGRCRSATGLLHAAGVAVSPDGRNVYGVGNGIAALARSGATGALTSVACPACARPTGLARGTAVAVSPDGRNVYVGSGGGKVGSLLVFSRDGATGRLTQLPGAAGCLAQNGAAACTPAVALQEPRAVAVSPDGRNAYVASATSAGVAVFSRAPTTGALTQLPAPNGCVTATGSSGRCRTGRGLSVPFDLALSADGRSLYVASYLFTGGSLAVFSRASATGALSQRSGKAGCVSAGGRGGCTAGRQLVALAGVAVTGDGRNVYTAAESRREPGRLPKGGGVGVFARTR